jgi:hypothetical protein
VLPTEARVLGLLTRIERELPYARFYFTDVANYRASIKGKMWWTPQDFRSVT